MSLILSPYRFAAAGPTDPYFANVVSLLHFDGPNGSTTFTDETGKTWTANGYAKISTAQSAAGGASGDFTHDALGDNIVCAHLVDFEFGTGDLTVEWWQYWNQVNLWQCPWIKGYQIAGAIGLATGNGDGRYSVIVGTGPTSVCTEASGAIAGNAYHHAYCRQGNTHRLYRGGVQTASGSDSSSLSNTSSLLVGNYPSSIANVSARSFIDEFRITKGVCRYPDGTTFTPPTAPFPNS